MISKIEQVSLNAWPALETKEIDGWVIRFANGVTKRANSVHAVEHNGMNAIEKIRYCEEFYFQRGQPSSFKISEISQPSGIDNLLESMGYSREFEVSVMMKDLSGFNKSLEKNTVRASENPDDLWLDNYLRMNETDISRKITLSAIMEKIPAVKGFLTLYSGSVPVGCGLGIVEDRFIGLYDIVIDKSYRMKGFGISLIENLLTWGKSKGADLAYLQVLAENKPAVGLYSKLGFSEEYPYWYRIKGKQTI